MTEKKIEITVKELDERLREAYVRGYNCGFARAKRLIERYKKAKKLIGELSRMFKLSKDDDGIQNN